MVVLNVNDMCGAHCTSRLSHAKQHSRIFYTKKIKLQLCNMLNQVVSFTLFLNFLCALAAGCFYWMKENEKKNYIEIGLVLDCGGRIKITKS